MSDELIERLRRKADQASRTPRPVYADILTEAADALAAAEKREAKALARIEAHERVLRWVAHDDPKGWADAHAEACNDPEMNAAVFAALEDKERRLP